MFTVCSLSGERFPNPNSLVPEKFLFTFIGSMDLTSRSTPCLVTLFHHMINIYDLFRSLIVVDGNDDLGDRNFTLRFRKDSRVNQGLRSGPPPPSHNHP